MDEQKRVIEEENTEETKNDSKETNANPKSNMASRARNRTVMLSPEMTGQVRAMLYKGNESAQTNEAFNKAVSNDWSRPEVGKSAVSNPQYPATEPAPKNVPEHMPSPNPEEVMNPRATGKMNPDFLNQVMSSINKQVPPERKEQITPARMLAASGINPVEPMVAPVAAAAAVSATPKVRVNGFEEPKKAAPTSKIIGFMVSFEGNEFGEIFEVRAGRWLITSRPTDQGEFIFINDPSVSPMHAVVRVTKEGKIQILDQLSEHGTGISKVGNNEEIDVTGSMVTVEHGDMVRFGNRHFVVCLVPDFRKAE